MGVPADQMGPVMEVLGQFAGEDELMTFDEFKGAYAALTGPGPDGPSGPDSGPSGPDNGPNGEEVCEGHAFDEESCLNIGCCQ